MNGRIVNLDVAVHLSVQEQLPMYLAGRLEAAAAAKLQQHLQSCAQCQQELEWQRTLRSASPPISPGLDMERALARLAPRLEAPPAAGLARWWQRNAANEPRWLRWTLACQAAAIAAMAVLLLRPEPPRYQLLGAAAAPANLVVTFQPGLAESELRAILQANHARLVGGPTETAAYLLAVPPAQRDPVLRRLRSEAGVKLAEPLGGSGDEGPP